MKKKYKIVTSGKVVEREYTYIPGRYILAVLITIFEILAIIGVVVALCYFVPYFYILAFATEVACVLKIVSSDDNPDYKVPWLLFVLILPIAGFMLYFIFGSRKLQKKFLKRLDKIKTYGYEINEEREFKLLKEESAQICSYAKMLCDISESHLFTNTKQTYFPLGEDVWKSILVDLENAKKFIYLEFFIINEGIFWDSILTILKQKASEGVDVRVVYDDIGCMTTLAGNYAKQLAKFNIKATPFSRLKGQADSEFNNRNHRKILVIDGKIGYTGGVNIADEYINEIKRFGHWKDTAVRLEGRAVYELTRLFLIDYGINVKNFEAPNYDVYPEQDISAKGYVIPFGDGPAPLYSRRVAKSLIQNMLSSANEYVYMTSPYLIIDNDLCTSIENTALRGVDVRIVVPHIPDKKLVFGMTKSFYYRLMKAGVKIYEYTPGFIHAKSYIVDGKLAMIGTINLDYRSLVHHFENGVWLYKTDCIKDMEKDVKLTLKESQEIKIENLKTNLIQKVIRSVVRIFAPLM
ncbi:MAG: cardiolipin synthase [Clostridia bacterium]|nr:cardiolipin synthase [Clostridia bacterium]